MKRTSSFRVPDPLTGPVTVVWDGRPGRRRWYARYRSPSTGRRTSRALGPDRTAATIEAQEIARAIARGELRGGATRLRLSDLLAEYVAHCRRKGDVDKHIRHIVSTVEAFLDFLEAKTLQDVTHDGLERYLDSLHAAGRAGRTVNAHRNHIRGLFRWARISHRITQDPVESVVKRDETVKKRRRRAEGVDTLRRVLRAASRRGARDWEPLAYRIAILAGLRQGEIIRLRWRNIDFDRGAYILAAAEQKSKRDSVTALAPELLDALKVHWKRSGCPGPDGLVLDIRNPSACWKRTLRAARVDYHDDAGRVFDWHALRHTFCTLLAKRPDVDFTTLQSLMRHATPQQTRQYVHPQLRLQTEALKGARRFTKRRKRPTTERRRRGGRRKGKK